MIEFEQVVNCDLRLLLDVGRLTPNAVIELDARDPIGRFCRRFDNYLRLSRIATEWRCAASPSASARANAVGASFASESVSQASTEVRLRKSSTESPEENRAVPRVGST